MKNLGTIFFLMFFLVTNGLSQNSEDCVDAHILATLPTSLVDIEDITIDAVIGSGTDPNEPAMDMTCFPAGHNNVQNDKHYWFAFSAQNPGTLEFMIHPENDATDYDFSIWEGFCPSDPCSQPLFCDFTSSNCLFPPTGVSDDPLGTFGADPLTSTGIYTSAINLTEGKNYFLLVINRNEFFAGCGPHDSLGFTIAFDGTATVGPLIERPTTEAKFPNINDTLKVCEGEAIGFSVTSVPFATSYDWVTQTTLPDAIITKHGVGDSVTVEFGSTSGQICMEMTCPIQSLVCWEVAGNRTPDLVSTSTTNVSCDPIDLSTRFVDNQSVVEASLSYHLSEAEALTNTNPLPSAVVGRSDVYWVRKTTPNGCFDVVDVLALTENIDIEPTGEQIICESTFFDLTDISFNEINGLNGTLAFHFYLDSLDAINEANQILPPTVFESGQYWVRAETQNQNQCFDIQSFDLVFSNQPNIAPIEPITLCGSECFNLINTPFTDLNGQPAATFQLTFYDNEADASAGNSNTIINSDICQSGTYWIRAASSISCFDIEKIEIIAAETPDIEDVNLTIDCTVGCLDLSTINFIENNGIDPAELSQTFYASQADASAATNPLANLQICQSRTVWLRMTHTNGCFDLAQIVITGQELSMAILSGNAMICQGVSTDLIFDFTGTPPYLVNYTDGSDTTTINVPFDTFREAVSPNFPTTYSLISVTDGNGCMASVEGNAVITVDIPPQADNISFACNTAATEYTVTFDLIGGDPSSYSVSGNEGTLTGNTFTSDPIATGTTYSFIISDATGCGPSRLESVFACECNSIVGTMDQMPIEACEREPVIATYLGGENLEKGDVLVYVLHDNPDTLLGTIFDNKNVPVFTYVPELDYGVTYFISAVITKEDLNGEPILSQMGNPCLSVAAGTPITFYDVPEMSFHLSTDSICLGMEAQLIFDLKGVGPFDVNYHNGDSTVILKGIENGHTVAISPERNTTYIAEFVNQSEVSNCLVDVMNVSTNLTVLGAPIVENFERFCNEEGTMLVVSFEISGGNSSTYAIDGLAGSLNGNVFTSDSIPHNTPYQIEVSDINNCTSEVLEGIAECNCTPDIMVAIEVNQPVSCADSKDAILSAEAINGLAPYTFRWSNGATGTVATDIAPGQVSVTMTDANGCEVMDSTSLEMPRSITAAPNISDPSCFEGNDGAIAAINAQGGSGALTFALNEGQFTSNSTFTGLTAGVYELKIKDENGCLWTMDQISLQNPNQLDVQLGGDLVLNLGDSHTFYPQVNQEVMIFEWSSVDTICTNCENPTISPGASTAYTLTVTNSAGCTASDRILVQIVNNKRIYVPTAFSPNGDGNNDVLTLYSGEEVNNIHIFRVFSRWGELVYEMRDMPSEASNFGWNGILADGQRAPAGVYIYYAEVQFMNGDSDIISGDVVLIR